MSCAKLLAGSSVPEHLAKDVGMEVCHSCSLWPSYSGPGKTVVCHPKAHLVDLGDSFFLASLQGLPAVAVLPECDSSAPFLGKAGSLLRNSGLGLLCQNCRKGLALQQSTSSVVSFLKEN